MNRKLTVTIGIPAFNEEANIRRLLEALLRQRQVHYRLKEILLCSDGSTDRTVQIGRRYESGLVKVYAERRRLGQQHRQNQLLKTFSSDVLVIMEADTLPFNQSTVDELVRPFCLKSGDNLGMVVGEALMAKPRTTYESILYHGYEMKWRIFCDWKQGENVYTCGGHAMRALSRTFCRQLWWPRHVPEDAYAYFRLRQLKLGLVRQPLALSLARNVANFRDRVRQVRKFVSGKESLLRHFGLREVQKQYSLPRGLVVRHLVSAFLHQPAWTILYLAEIAMNRLITFRSGLFTALYEPYPSSKNFDDIP